MSDAMPEVGFDIRLGQLYSSIEFDYGVYTGELRKAGLDSREIADKRLHYAYGENTLTTNLACDSDALGVCAWESGDEPFPHEAGQMFVYDKNFRFAAYPDNVSATTMHETGHAHDRSRLSDQMARIIFHANNEQVERYAEHFAAVNTPCAPLISATVRPDKEADYQRTRPPLKWTRLNELWVRAEEVFETSLAVVIEQYDTEDK